MLTSFLITFRESLEAALIVGILLGFLTKTKQKKYSNLVYLSIGAGIFGSVAFAVAFHYFAGGLKEPAEQIFEGATMILAALLLTFMIFWMLKQKHVALHYHRKMQEKVDAGKMFGLFMVGFVSILREGVETVIFLNAARFANGPNNIIGALLGVTIAIILGYLIFAGSMKISLKKFFNVTSILLVLFAAGLVAHGVHEFQEIGLAPIFENEAWNINPIVQAEGIYPMLHENGIIGSLLKGLFGYNGNPSMLEVIVYFFYIIGIYWIYRKIDRNLSVPNKARVQ